MGGLFSKKAEAKFDPLTDLVDLKGKVVIVTGSNKGIGFATVQYLVRAGAKVYLAARDESRATGAIAKLEAEGLGPGNGQVIWLKLDLSDPRDAKKAAEDFLSREKRLDVLINNAGVVGLDGVGRDGVSSLFIINYISPYVFTRTLLPLLEETAKEPNSDVRIVNVSSMTHSLTPSSVRFKDIPDFNVSYKYRPLGGLTKYGHSKLAIILWSKHLQEQLKSRTPPTPITVIALHPGGVDTYSTAYRWPLNHILSFLMGLAMAQPTEGAHTSVFAAAGKPVRDEPEKYQGAYLVEKPVGKVETPSALALDEKLGEDLIVTTEKFLKEIGV